MDDATKHLEAVKEGAEAAVIHFLRMQTKTAFSVYEEAVFRAVYSWLDQNRAAVLESVAKAAKFGR